MEKESVLGVKLEDVNSINQRLIIDVPAEFVAKSAKKALEEIKKEAKIPGFRQGKVPDDMIKGRLGKTFANEFLQQVVRDTYPEAVRLSGAVPISDPKIDADIEKLDEKKSFTYTAVFEIYPKVTPEGYEGLKLEKEKVVVTDDEIDQELNQLQQQMTQLEPAKDASIEKGVMARVDFSGTADGKKFSGSEAKDFIVDLDASNLLPVFEKNVIGMREGEEKVIEFDYPEDYFNMEIAGSHGVFNVKVKELRRKIVPALDDGFAKDLGFKTFEELRKAMRDRIEGFKDGHQRALMHRQIMELLSKNHEIDVPDSMVSRELGHMLEELMHEMEKHGKTLQQAGITADDFVKTNLEEAKLRVRANILLDAIGKKEALSVSDGDVDVRIKAIAAATNQQEQKVRTHFEEQNLMPGLKHQLLVEKALDFIIGKAKIKEAAPKKEKK